MPTPVRLRAVAVALLALSATSGAFGQETDAEAEPEASLRNAVTAYERDDLATAQRWFERAHAEQPTARTLRGLGVVAYRQGRHAAAYSLLTQSLSSTVKPLTESLRTRVLSLVAELERTVTRVAFQVRPETSELRIDGVLPPRDGAGEVVVEPGVHQAVLSAPGYVSSRWDFEAEPGLTLRRDWALAAVPPAAAEFGTAPRAPNPTTASPRPAAPPDGRRTNARKTRAYAAVGVAAAGVVVAAIAAGLGISRVNTIEEACRGQPDHTCSPTAARAEQSRARLPLLSGLAIGGAITASLGAISGIWLLTAARGGDPGSPPRVGVEARLVGQF